MPKGRLYLILSAVLYGIIPSVSAMAYRGGLNGITLTFLRSTIALPVLYAMIAADRRPLRLSTAQGRQVFILGLIGGTMPILLLYISYQYIPTGLAATLHFIYPLLIVIAAAVISRTRPPRRIWSAVMLVTMGIFMFADLGRAVNRYGVMLAVLSGVFYSFYVVYLGRSGLDRLDHAVLTFYTMLIISVSTLVFGAWSGKLYFNITPLSWCCAAIISIISVLGAMPLFQLGIRYAGAEEAGIYSALEPVTSVAAGAAVLGELFGAAQLMGAALIVFGVLLCRKMPEPQHGM